MAESFKVFKINWVKGTLIFTSIVKTCMSCTDVVHTKLKLLQIARYDNVCIVPLPSTSSLPAGSPAQTGPRGT